MTAPCVRPSAVGAARKKEKLVSHDNHVVVTSLSRRSFSRAISMHQTAYESSSNSNSSRSQNIIDNSSTAWQQGTGEWRRQASGDGFFPQLINKSKFF